MLAEKLKTSAFYQIRYSSKIYLNQVQVDNQSNFCNCLLFLCRSLSSLAQEGFGLSREYLGGNDKENQAQPRKKPHKVSPDLSFSYDACSVIVILVVRIFRVFERAHGRCLI